MITMKKILCPVDFSPAANNAVEYAANMARHLHARLILLHVLKIPTLQDVANLSAGFPSTMNEREERLQAKLNGYASEVEKRFSIPCTAHVRIHQSDINSALKTEVESADYDLVVMGTNGADDLYQFYFGTHTYSIIRHTARALLVVPEGCGFAEPKHIVYASSYHECDADNIRHLFELTGVFQPSVTVLHVSHKPTAISEDVFHCVKHVMEENVDRSELHFERVVGEDIAIGIDDFMHRQNRDLLVLLTGRYSLVKSIFHESATKKLSAIATYPIMIVRPEEN